MCRRNYKDFGFIILLKDFYPFKIIIKKLFKDFYLFKIVEVKNFFKQKLIIDLIILNKWESFSRNINKWYCPLKDYIISPGAY